jgi:Putative zinc dependent peptidase (DUF5700)
MWHLALIFLLTAPPRSNVRIVTDEADAVLAILDARAEGRGLTDADWRRVFASEGYVRLKKREHAMGRAFEDDAFRTFVASPELLAKRAALRRALDRVKRADLDALAKRAFAYLPPSARIDATIYPVIKPATNSFVFEHTAIFKYLDGDEPLANFEETVAHEMHHIGFGTACAHTGEKWLGAFGEGFAAYAAGGGLRGHPYANAEPDVRAAWASGVADFAGQFAQLERFFEDVAEGKLKGDDVDKRAFEFYGLVGPWYTVGWKMAGVIEEELGRDALIDAFCDSSKLMATYNRAADAHEKRTGERLPHWSARISGSAAR